MTRPILSVVQFRTPEGKVMYVGSGGHTTDDLQKAQLFGFSKRGRESAQRYLRYYKESEGKELPVLIKEAE